MMNKQKLVILIIAVIGMISVFLPWMHMPFVGSVNGAHGWNLIVLALFAVPAVLTLVGERTERLSGNWLYAAIIPGLICSIKGIVAVVRVQSAMSGAGEDNPFAELVSASVSIGFGLILTIVAGIAIAIAAYVVKDQEQAE